MGAARRRARHDRGADPAAARRARSSARSTARTATGSPSTGARLARRRLPGVADRRRSGTRCTYALVATVIARRDRRTRRGTALTRRAGRLAAGLRRAADAAARHLRRHRRLRLPDHPGQAAARPARLLDAGAAGPGPGRGAVRGTGRCCRCCGPSTSGCGRLPPSSAPRRCGSGARSNCRWCAGRCGSRPGSPSPSRSASSGRRVFIARPDSPTLPVAVARLLGPRRRDQLRPGDGPFDHPHGGVRGLAAAPRAPPHGPYDGGVLMALLTLGDATVRFGARPERRMPRSTRSSSTSPSTRSCACSAPAAAASRRCCGSSPGCRGSTAGRVLLDGRDQAGVPAHRRGVGLMFQDHQLFPQRDVGGNVAFGLRMHGAARAERQRPVQRTARPGRPARRRGARRRPPCPAASSSASHSPARSRPEPRLLMLDEPLGQLDRSLRERLVVELRDLFEELGTTVLAVTHDQGEAFALADRVVVMRDGRIAQSGTPLEVWQRPADEFVARFLGFDNITEATVSRVRPTRRGAGCRCPRGPPTARASCWCGPRAYGWGPRRGRVCRRGRGADLPRRARRRPAAAGTRAPARRGVRAAGHPGAGRGRRPGVRAAGRRRARRGQFVRRQAVRRRAMSSARPYRHTCDGAPREGPAPRRGGHHAEDQDVPLVRRQRRGGLALATPRSSTTPAS